MRNKANFAVLSPIEFLADFVEEAEHAHHRVWAQAMEVEPGKHTDQLLAALIKSAQRGVVAKLHVDTFSFMVTDGVFNYWPFVSSPFRRSRNKRRIRKQEMISNLRNGGVQVMCTNPPTFLDKVLPTRGRNHMKIAIVDTTAWIGGVNFHEGNFTSQDVMIRITDPAITAEIAYIYELVDKGNLTRDMKITCNDETALLIDSGQINRSLILREAKKAIEQAKTSLLYISLLIPDSAILLALSSAKNRNVSVDVILPSSAMVTGIFQLVDRFNDFMMRVRGITLAIRYKSFPIHAKILITDHTSVIIGSHNFSSRGVRMGTAEIALQSSNPTLVANLIAFYTQLAEKK